jgi:O-antigen/teichoic acid export membrane protein
VNAKLKSLRSGIQWGSLYAGSLLVNKVLRGAVVPKLLDPSAYGLFTSINLVTRYLQFADFGAAAYCNKQLPHYYYNMPPEEASKFISRMYMLVLCSFALTTTYLAVAVFLAPKWSGGSELAVQFYTYALILLIPITIISKLRDFALTLFIAKQDYRGSVTFQIANNYITLVFVAGGIYYWGAIGGIIGTFLGELLSFLWIVRQAELPSVSKPGRYLLADWRSIIKQFYVQLADLALGTVDQLLILSVFNVEGLGIYALGLSFSWAIEALSEIFNTASYPKLMAVVRARPQEAIELCHTTILSFFLISFAAMPCALLLIDQIVSRYFDRYLIGLNAFGIMLMLGLIRGGSALLRRAYVAFDMERSYILVSSVALITYSIMMVVGSKVRFELFQIISAIVVINTLLFLVSYAVLAVRLRAVSGFAKNAGLAMTAAVMLFAYSASAVDKAGELQMRWVVVGSMFIIPLIWSFFARKELLRYVG